MSSIGFSSFSLMPNLVTSRFWFLIMFGITSLSIVSVSCSADMQNTTCICSSTNSSRKPLSAINGFKLSLMFGNKLKSPLSNANTQPMRALCFNFSSVASL